MLLQLGSFKFAWNFNLILGFKGPVAGRTVQNMMSTYTVLRKAMECVTVRMVLALKALTMWLMCKEWRSWTWNRSAPVTWHVPSTFTLPNIKHFPELFIKSMSSHHTSFDFNWNLTCSFPDHKNTEPRIIYKNEQAFPKKITILRPKTQGTLAKNKSKHITNAHNLCVWSAPADWRVKKGCQHCWIKNPNMKTT